MATSTRPRRKHDDERARHAALVAELEAAGREHSNAVVMFHAALAERLGLNATDHKVLDLLERLGPLSPGKVAELTGLAPASVTGVLDRLEARGFIRRGRDPGDGRRQVVETVQQRTPEVERLFDGLLAEVRRICASRSPDELAAILDWLREVTEAQRAAAIELASGEPEGGSGRGGLSRRRRGGGQG